MQGCVMGRVWQQEVNDQQFASAYAQPTKHVIAIVHAQPATSHALNPALTSTSVWHQQHVCHLNMVVSCQLAGMVTCPTCIV